MIPRALLRVLRYSLVILVTAVATALYCRWFQQSRPGKPANPFSSQKMKGPAPPQQQRYELRHQFANTEPDVGKEIHRGYGKDEPAGPLDNCPMLAECFPSADSIYASYDACHRSMKFILRHYDNAIVIDKETGRSVGFISFHVERNPANKRQAAINIYNVCVHQEHRGQGLAKRLLSEGLAGVMEYYVDLRRRSPPPLDEPILLALDVDLRSSMAAESFSMYAKAGFLRAWQPCRSIADVDWRPLYLADQRAESVSSPMASMLTDLSQYVANELEGRQSRRHLPSRSNSSNSSGNFDHYCMFKWHHEDWVTMGRAIALPFQPPEKEKINK
jgi:GNAT superfamily N-acetyltransferase